VCCCVYIINFARPFHSLTLYTGRPPTTEWRPRRCLYVLILAVRRLIHILVRILGTELVHFLTLSPILIRGHASAHSHSLHRQSTDRGIETSWPPVLPLCSCIEQGTHVKWNWNKTETKFQAEVNQIVLFQFHFSSLHMWNNAEFVIEHTQSTIMLWSERGFWQVINSIASRLQSEFAVLAEKYLPRQHEVVNRMPFLLWRPRLAQWHVHWS